MTAQATPWPPVITGQTYRLRSNFSQFTSPITGTIQRSARSGARFEFDVDFGILDDVRGYAWRAAIAQYQDSAQTFYWSPYPQGRPRNFQGDPFTVDSDAYTADTTELTADNTFAFGDPLISGASQSGNAVTISGVTPGAVFVPGDFVAFDNPVYREMHLITAPATADASGNITLAIVPPIRRSPSDGAGVYFDGHTPNAAYRCACEVIVADNAQAQYQLSGFQTTMSLKFIEAIR